MWMIHILNIFCSYKLNKLGIIPRNYRGLKGIFLSPFLHGNIKHLLSNSFYFLILSILICSYSFYIYALTSIYIVILCGLFTWALGRSNTIHIGASGLIMGYWGFLVPLAYFKPSSLSFILLGVTTIKIGQLIYCLLLNRKKNISWECHLFGFVSGVFSCFLITL